MADWTSEYVRMIEDCEQRSRSLNSWELGFLDSVRRQIEAGRRPTPAQIEKLEDIWEVATARG